MSPRPRFGKSRPANVVRNLRWGAFLISSASHFQVRCTPPAALVPNVSGALARPGRPVTQPAKLLARRGIQSLNAKNVTYGSQQKTSPMFWKRPPSRRKHLGSLPVRQTFAARSGFATNFCCTTAAKCLVRLHFFTGELRAEKNSQSDAATTTSDAI